MNLLIKNANIYTGIDENWIFGDLLIKDGIIQNIGSFNMDNVSVPPDFEVVDLKEKLIVPGLINAHVHSYTGLLKGTVDSVPLDIYMLYAIAAGSKRTAEEIYLSTMISVLQMLKTGTTSVIDHFSQRPLLDMQGIDAAASAFNDAGIRALIAPMYSDKSYFDTVPMEKGDFPDELKPKSSNRIQTPQDYYDLTEAAIKKYNTKDSLTRIIIGTDGPQRCTKELLDITARLEEKYKVGWHTHVLEAKTQAIMAERLFKHSLIEELDSYDLLNSRTSLVHAVWMTEKDADIVIKRNSTMVHCAYSNLFIGNGIAPADHYINKGMSIALGSDGNNCGDVNMFDKIRLSAILHRSNPDYDKWLNASNIMETALKGGSKAMLMQDSIGSLEIGKKADFLVLNIDNTLWQPVNKFMTQLVYYENGSSVEDVYVSGRKVVSKGKSLLVDEEDIIKKANEAAQMLKRDNQDAFDFANKQASYFRNMHIDSMKKNIGMERYPR